MCHPKFSIHEQYRHEYKRVHFDKDENLIILTKEGMTFKGWLVVSYPKENGCHEEFKEIRVPIHTIVCGKEEVRHLNKKPLTFNFEIGKTHSKEISRK